jgi:hypothetical protein
VIIYGPQWLRFEPLQLLNFDIITDLDPAFHSNADSDPPSQNNADPNLQPGFVNYRGRCYILCFPSLVCRLDLFFSVFYILYCFLYCIASFTAPRIPLCRRILCLNSELLQLTAVLLTTRLHLIYKNATSLIHKNATFHTMKLYTMPDPYSTGTSPF